MAESPENRSETAARILSAADELLGERGYAAVSMRDVGERAGVNKALVFYYFSTKEALFERVLERYYEGHLDALRAAFEAGGDLAERLHRVVDAYVDFIEANKRYPRIVQHEIAGPGTHHALIRKNLAPLFRWFEEALAEVAPADGPLAARHLFVTFSGAVINYFTYAPLLEATWGRDPLAKAAIDERRAHLHWLVDRLLEGLSPESEGRGAGAC
jgi:TetR/AcrR family transcriptional regulator